MKKTILFTALCCSGFAFSQTINFKGCENLFENQTFIFTKSSTNDSFGKKIYVTTPVTGDQPCGGLGTCEFKLQWNNTDQRWDFLADSGNGDFVNPYLIYYSSTGNSTATNPPNIAIGTWIENVSETQGLCGGNLTSTNATMTGDVRTSTLAVDSYGNSKISLYPNPATEFISVVGMKEVKSAKIISAEGRLLLTFRNVDKIDISKLTPGVYLLEIESDQASVQRIKFIKK